MINKILISEYNFAVNVVMDINIAIHKAFITHNLVNKLFIAKMSYIFNVLVFVKVYANKFMQIKSKKGTA